MKKSALTTLLLGAQAGASVALCVLCVLWFQRSREFNLVNGVMRGMIPALNANKSAFTQLIGDSAAYSEKNAGMRTLLNQMVGTKLPPLNTNSSPAKTGH
jgi:hypothetical protein